MLTFVYTMCLVYIFVVSVMDLLVRNKMDVFTMQPELNDAWFLNDLKWINNGLLEALSDESLKKHIWVYLTWDKTVDEKILYTISLIFSWSDSNWKKGDIFEFIPHDLDDLQNDNLKKLLFILRIIIVRKDFLWWPDLSFSDEIKKNIKSILLTAVNKYSMEDLKLLSNFGNITFDILHVLNDFDDGQWKNVKKIMQLLNNDLWITIFPISISADNLENIKDNIIYLKETPIHNVNVFKDNWFNQVFLANWRPTIVDLLSLSPDDFKLVAPSIWSDVNMLSIEFLWHEVYKEICNELRKRWLIDAEISKILSDFKYKKCITAVPFWIDKWFSLDILLALDNYSTESSYEQREYIYDNLTQNPNQLSKLFEFKYDTLLYIYNNITNDVDEIINNYYFIKDIESDNVKQMYECIQNYQIDKVGENFGKIVKFFSVSKYCHYNTGPIMEFFCKYFIEELFYFIDDDEFRWIITRSSLENYKFFYENWICNSIRDFVTIKHLLYQNIDSIKYLYDNWLCVLHSDFIRLSNSVINLNTRVIWYESWSRFGTVKYLYEKWMYTSLDDLLSPKYSLIFWRDVDEVKLLCENKICNSLDDFLLIEWGNYKEIKYLIENHIVKSLQDIIKLKTIINSDIDCLKYLYDKKICITFDDFLKLEQSWKRLCKIETIMFFYTNRICNSVDDFAAIWNCIWEDIEVIKYFYDKWICTNLDNFVICWKINIESWYLNHIKYLFENRITTTINDLTKYEHIISFADDTTLSILNYMYNNDVNFNEKVDLFWIIGEKWYSEVCKNEITHKIWYLPIDIANKYVKICEIFDNSNSPDIQVVKDRLMEDVLNVDNPEEVVKKIDAIFLQSDLPFVSKIFQIFKYIYTEDHFNHEMEYHGMPSHYLQSHKTYEKKLETIYQDLMKIMIKSWESSLKEFIESIISCKDLIYDFESWKTLTSEWYKQIISFMKKIVSLRVIINNQWNNVETLKFDGDINIKILKEYYENLKKTLLIKEWDSLYAFFLRLCKKIWYNSLEDIILDMEKTQIKSNNNWLHWVNSMKDWEIFDCSSKYFLKWINMESFWEILNRGVTSTEYLWWWEWTDDKVWSNWTPFDIDGVVINWENVFNIATTHWYWDLAIIINLNKLWIYNTDTWLEWYRQDLYEIFKNHKWDNSYYWIRTWIASTEFDAIIYKEKDVSLEKLQRIKYLIVKKGFYLPVLDLEWNLLFTPEEYHKLRQCFSFSEKYKWCDVEKINWDYDSVKQRDIINEWDETFKLFVQNQKELSALNEKIDSENFAKEVFEKIKNTLESELWIQCNKNKNLLWAELYDSWSTWRWTEIPSNDIDLDFTLLLNSEDYKRLEQIKKTIHDTIWTIELADHGIEEWTWLQLKSVKNDLWKEYWFKDWIHFDLLILKKTQSYLYPSNIAMQDRYKKIEEEYGKETLDFVKENIVIMKKLLKSQWRYKNTEWWLWGIWVENWIMQHHWNFIEALEWFEQVAYGGQYEEWKENIPLEEFKKHYYVWDSWQNFRVWNNDNYILKMNEAGYKWTLNIIKKYREQWLDWISQLIQDYETNKAEFLK